MALLAAHDIPVVPSHLCRTADEARHAATKPGFPVVAKIVSRYIVHKSDIGGVRLGLRDEATIVAAFDQINAAARQRAPGATIDVVVIAPMVSGGVECILGVQNDPSFGPVVMFGLGGVFVEVLKDVSFRAAPFDRQEALSMIREIKGAAILEACAAHRPPTLTRWQTLAALSRFAAATGERLAALDINPFLVRPRGRGALALDAVVIGATNK